MSHLGHRLSALIDGELSHPQRERVLAHLAHCEPCRREAAALRTLKQRMHALGEATADTSLTDRLIAVAGVAGPVPWGRRLPLLGRRAVPGGPRRRWPIRSLAVAGLTLAGLGVPAAAFLAGGGQQNLGPSVTPAIDMFVVQHEISTGNAPPMAPAAALNLPGALVAPAAPAPPASGSSAAEAPSGTGVLSAAGATAASAAAAALTRVAAVSTRVAAPRANAAAGRAGRAGRPHPVMTPAGAR